MQFVYNPFTGNLDLIDPDLRVDTSVPSGQADGYADTLQDGSINGVIYFFVNGHRYKLVGTLDDHIGEGMGLLLAITYAA